MKANSLSTAPSLFTDASRPLGGAASRAFVLRGLETIRLEGFRVGAQLRVIEGLLWITQEGDSADYLVGPDESFFATRAGRIVAQSLTPESRFVFTATHR